MKRRHISFLLTLTLACALAGPAVAEAMGLTVEYQPETSRVTCAGQDGTVWFTFAALTAAPAEDVP